MVQISAVVFDVGKVLFDWDLRHLFEKEISEPEKLDWFLANVVPTDWHFQADQGRAVANMVTERTAEFPQYAPLLDIYATRFIESIPGPIPGSLEIVAELAAKNVPLFAITNFGAEFWAAFRPTQPVFDHFRDIVVSGVEKLAKPDPAIFALALERFGLSAGEAIFIDDNHANIISAQSNGFVGHHFVNAAELRTDLVKLGLVAPQ
jgi:2-haloacid dehalogenase